jgi:hypothetical protein
MWQTDLQIEKMRATINARDRQRTIEETDMEVKGEDPAITTITALTAKYPQDIKTTATKATAVKVRDTVATAKMTTKSFSKGNPESTTHHQRICSTDHVIFTPRLSMGNEYPDM